jgi:transcriptional regulator with PAS, ATPase and Fis domain
MNLQEIKNRFSIIGNSALLDRALEVAIQVASTDLTVLISGESGVGKEVFSKIIHQQSPRKHGNFIAVNCGAIPEGTIDSELFGHEKGSFTGATDARKGYFEVVNGGTIFLDEVAELPLGTQVRLLRVLETGEFIRVGASKPLKTNVRVVAATNVNMARAVETGRFREDLFYRLNTVPIRIPALRERKDDVHLLFRKFAADFAEKYRIPVIRLEDDAVRVMEAYRWPGNVRQLKNVAEQISILEKDRHIHADTIVKYLPDYKESNLPVRLESRAGSDTNFEADKEIIYKILFEMKKDMNDLKKLVMGVIDNGGNTNFHPGDENSQILKRFFSEADSSFTSAPAAPVLAPAFPMNPPAYTEDQVHEEEVEESLSLSDKEKALIEKALIKHRGKRKSAASELGISERTLYRKIKEYNIKG